MPTYDYKCNECGHLFEEFQSMSSATLIDCPSCGKPSLKRLFAGGAGMIFKGSGFYLTDYKNSGSSSREPAKSSSPANDTAPAESKPGSPSTPSSPSTPKTSE